MIVRPEGREDVEDYDEDNLEWFRQYGDFKQGIPVQDIVALFSNLIPPSNFNDVLFCE